MATNLDIISNAFRIANITRELEVPSAAQGAQALTSLNRMLADWRKDGIELGYYPQTSLAATIPLQDEDLRGVEHNLAEELAGNYGAALTPQKAKIARDTKDRLEKSTTEIFETSYDHMPLGGTRGIYNISNG